MSNNDSDTATTPLARYVAALPDGLESYPEFRLKAAFTRSLILQLPARPTGLPQAIMRLLDHPPMISAWIPEVHHQALLLGLAETSFGGDDQALLDSTFHMQQALLGGRIYAPLLQLLNPALLLRQASKRWTNFHRGTTLEVLHADDTTAAARVSHPRGMYSTLGLESLASGFRAALEASRCRERNVRVVHAGETHTDFDLCWS